VSEALLDAREVLAQARVERLDLRGRAVSLQRGSIALERLLDRAAHRGIDRAERGLDRLEAVQVGGDGEIDGVRPLAGRERGPRRVELAARRRERELAPPELLGMRAQPGEQRRCIRLLDLGLRAMRERLEVGDGERGMRGGVRREPPAARDLVGVEGQRAHVEGEVPALRVVEARGEGRHRGPLDAEADGAVEREG